MPLIFTLNLLNSETYNEINGTESSRFQQIIQNGLNAFINNCGVSKDPVEAIQPLITNNS